MSDTDYKIKKRLDKRTGVIIKIEMWEDYRCRYKVRMRNNFQKENWLRQWRDAKERGDSRAMDELDAKYERIGLP